MTYPFPPLLLRDDRLPPTEAPVTAPRIALDPDRLEHDLARILLGLMEMLRQIMELQAIRRMEAGSLSKVSKSSLARH